MKNEKPLPPFFISAQCVLCDFSPLFFFIFIFEAFYKIFDMIFQPAWKVLLNFRNPLKTTKRRQRKLGMTISKLNKKLISFAHSHHHHPIILYHENIRKIHFVPSISFLLFLHVSISLFYIYLFKKKKCKDSSSSS